MGSNFTKKNIADMFLSRSDEMILEIQARTMGEDPLFDNVNVSWLHKHMEMFMKIVEGEQLTGQGRLIYAKTTSNIIDLLAEGKVTIDEAERLMAMLVKQNEVDILPRLEEQLIEFNNNRSMK